jgi:CheY-like chemotaxis protein
MDNVQEDSDLTKRRASGKMQTILVIDDDRDILALDRAILEMDGYSVITARCGADGLDVLNRTEKIDLILLDLCMDKMSGFGFLKELEKQKPQLLAKVPVVFVTGMASVPNSPAVGVINKPYEIDTFLYDVRTFIKGGVKSYGYLH